MSQSIKAPPRGDKGGEHTGLIIAIWIVSGIVFVFNHLCDLFRTMGWWNYIGMFVAVFGITGMYALWLITVVLLSNGG